MNRRAWDITPKNIYQGMAVSALLDPDIDLVILTGAAGAENLACHGCCS